ncbi:putative dolichyl-diphosphooligosaccharide--protein glycosyltransferase subunit 3b [Quercus suber]|uniref:Dolichyl-diphosphooligosaccharide--protein glycosyltransferase subunit 3b n=1 Tax=Quercus suber TaxID=58331 RepID=A0AAW0J6Y1_QUESU
MVDQSKPMSQRFQESAPTSRQAVNFLTAVTIGATLLFLSGLTLTGTVIALITATHIPAGIVIFLVATGFIFSGGCGVAAITALSWLYNYLTGQHPMGADKLDYARMRIADKARDVKERARDYGQFAQQRVQEAKTKLPVSPIHRPLFLSTRQLGFIVVATLVWIPFAIKKIMKGETLLHDLKLWLAGSVFVYFFNISGAMHNIIQKMLMGLANQNDPNKLVFFYQGFGM